LGELVHDPAVEFLEADKYSGLALCPEALTLRFGTSSGLRVDKLSVSFSAASAALKDATSSRVPSPGLGLLSGRPPERLRALHSSTRCGGDVFSNRSGRSTRSQSTWRKWNDGKNDSLYLFGINVT
jgi:hypothetical protein